MGKVFFDVGMSLDGFIAGPNGRPGNPLGDGGTRIHEWVYPLAAFRERIGLPGGDTNHDDEVVRAVLARTGAYVMGRRMFDEGEVGWPENPPFRAPVIVVTRHARDPVRPPRYNGHDIGARRGDRFTAGHAPGVSGDEVNPAR